MQIFQTSRFKFSLQKDKKFEILKNSKHKQIVATKSLKNNMNYMNLAIVVGPSVFRPREESLEAASEVS
jgi:hypothetical protein